MFCFGSETDGVFTLVQNEKGYVYTWPDEKTAQEYFKAAKVPCHIYQIDPDMEMAALIENGKNTLGAPQLVRLLEDQKQAIYKSFVYKSLLAWTPYPEAVEV